MKALVYHGPGQRALENVPAPTILSPTDAIVRVTYTTICGTDLHILRGDVPLVAEGRILGHEGVGVVQDVGAGVTNFKVGDHVVISCITACGKCANCKRGMYSHCLSGGGWVLGHLIDGTQAEYVRIPFADNSLHLIPSDINVDEEMLVLLSDVLPTGFECGVLSGQVKPGDTVAIVGAGPIGLAVLLTAQFYSPSAIIVVDNDENRLEAAKKLGATLVLHNDLGNAAEKVLALTNNRGVDVAVEAVGLPGSFDVCQSIITAGGHIANVGVHGKPVSLNLEKLWAQNITLTTRLVDAVTTPMLLNSILAGRLQTRDLITHRFTLDELMQAYDLFDDAMTQQAIKVIISSGH